MRRVHPGMSPIRAGLIALVVVVVGVYLAFTKAIPLRHHYEIQAVFQSSNLLMPRSPVRIAGVDVGKVVKVGRYKDTDLAVATLRIDDSGRPLHRDMTLKIRPRLFLEGNFYVDVAPGTPNAPEVPDGGLIGLSQTATPVQLDQVLTALQADTRGSLQRTVQGLGQALNGKPGAAEDARQDPAVRGLTGGQALNETLRTSPEALRGTGQVTGALLGTEPHDLSRLIHGFARAMTALADNERALGDLVVDFNTTMATTAAHRDQLQATIALLGPTAQQAGSAFRQLTAALPATREFSRTLAASLPELPATIRAAQPWLAQARPLLGSGELGGLLSALSPATSDLGSLAHSTRAWLPRIDAFNRCITDVILPTGNVLVDDGALSAGVENYKEFWYAMVGQAGEGQGFDGNGAFLRLLTAGGANTIQTGKTNFSQESFFGNATAPPLMTRPAYSNALPPLTRDTPCAKSPVPDVNGPASTGPADGSRPGAPAPSSAAVDGGGG